MPAGHLDLPRDRLVATQDEAGLAADKSCDLVSLPRELQLRERSGDSAGRCATRGQVS